MMAADLEEFDMSRRIDVSLLSVWLGFKAQSLHFGAATCFVGVTLYTESMNERCLRVGIDLR
jgi:hypothetical protein